MTIPFDASKIKLNRAAKHLEELEGEVSAYLSGAPCAIVVEPFFSDANQDTFGTRAWIARIRKPVPLSLSAIIGDVVHNLRTALDLLACDLVRLNGNSTKGVYFPFCDIGTDLPHVIRARHLNRAGSDVVQVIHSLKPFKGGNIALRAIHDMDIADKHQMLLPMIGAVSVPIGGILNFPVEYQLQNLSTLVVKDGQIVVGLPKIPGTPELGTELPARFSLALTDLPSLGNR